MPEEQENQDKLSQSIAEQYAKEMARAETMAREKQRQRIAEQKMASSQFDERLNTAPKSASEAEQFQSLGKGDIGAEDTSAVKRKPDWDEEQNEGAGSPQNQMPKTARERDQAQTLAMRQGTDRGKMGGRNLSPIKRRAASEFQREIKSTENEIAGLKSAELAAKSMGIGRAILRWGQIVLGGYSTIILGIIFTIASIIVVPLIVIAGLVGLLPASGKEKEAAKKLAQAQEKLSAQKKKLELLKMNRF